MSKKGKKLSSRHSYTDKLKNSIVTFDKKVAFSNGSGSKKLKMPLEYLLH